MGYADEASGDVYGYDTGSAGYGEGQDFSGGTWLTPTSWVNDSTSPVTPVNSFGPPGPLEQKELDTWNAQVGAGSKIGAVSRAGSGGATTYGSPIGFPMPTMPTFTPPTYTPPGAYVPPAYDQRKANVYSQKYASPYLSELRRSIRSAITRSGVTGNPIVQKYAMEGAMGAAGEGFGKVMGAAGEYGRKAYGEEYGRDLAAYGMNWGQTQEAAKMNYQAALSAEQAKFNANIAAFMAGLKSYYQNPATGSTNWNTSGGVNPWNRTQ